MASPYGTGRSRSTGGSPYGSGRSRSSGGSVYGSGRRRVSSGRKEQKSVGGFLGNLWSDVEDAVIGVGTMPVILGRDVVSEVKRHPWTATSLPYHFARTGYRRVAKPTAESYEEQYGPLLRGDFEEFGRRFYDHPLGPILDATAILSGGTTAAAKAGIAPAALKRGAIELRTPSGRLVQKALPKQTLRAELQIGANALLNKLPPTTPAVGEAARAARQLRKVPLRQARARELQQEPFLKSLSKLRSKSQRLGTFWLSQVPLPEDLGRLAHMLDEEGGEAARATAALVRQRKFADAYFKPTPRMNRALEEAGYVAEAQRALLGISEETAKRRAYMPTLISRGAKFGDEGLEPGPGYSSVQEMIQRIDADLEAAGRPKPVYMPHTSEAPKFSDLYGSGGKGPTRKQGPLHRTMGVLLGRGQLIQDPEVLLRSFRSSVKGALYEDMHALHLEHSVPLAPGQPIPRGWTVVRRSHSERTPYTTKTGADFEDFAQQYLDKDGEFTFADNPFVTKGAEALVDAQGYQRIVPEEFSRHLAGEFVRANRFLRILNRYPVRVWRHLVLKLRPAWLVNNIIGNTLLYAIHSADPVALQELGTAFKRAFPGNADAFDRLMRKHFPEHVSGTFIGSQLPLSQPGSRLERFIERPASFLGAGLAQVDRKWEQALRSAVVRTELRKSPELRAVAGKMRGQTAEFWSKADAALNDNPLLVEQVSNRVNDALGDFLALGRVERDVIRSAFPFYAWFRVISLLTFKLPLTHPYKAPLLARLGQTGTTSVLEEMGFEDEDVINYAKGFVPLGEESEGRIPGLTTGGMNPYATVAQLQDFVGALAAGEPGEAWEYMPGANPFFSAPLEYVSGSGKARYRKNRFGLLGSFLRPVEDLPQVRLGASLTGRTYTGSPENPTLVAQDDPLEAIYRYLGIPYARVSPKRIEELSER